METSGTLPRAGLTAEDAPEVAAVYRGDPPFVSVYLDTTSEVEKAADRARAHWKDARRRLAEAGAPEAALEAVDELVPRAHTEGQTLAVVADAGGVRYVGHEPEPPVRDLARVGELPSIAPIVEWRQMAAPHVVVLCDRRGADVFGVRHEEAAIAEEVASEASDDTIRKSAPGGWSQRRFQQRAENAWEHTADDVAEKVAAVADRVGARVIAVAGDVRMVSMLRESLPARWAGLVAEVHGERNAGASMGDVAAEVVRLVASRVAEDTVEALQKLREERGQRDRAAEGVDHTLAALREARVGLLLVHDDPDDERTAWFGPEGTHVAARRADLEALGVTDGRQARLVDVAVRSALLTGAGVRVVPGAGGPRDSLGAILRY